MTSIGVFAGPLGDCLTCGGVDPTGTGHCHLECSRETPMRDLTTIRAITLKNPWAHLIAHHGKTVENRGWMPREGVDRLLIHAGKGWEDGQVADDWRYSTAETVVTSAVVAIADLAFACDTSRSTRTLTCGCDPNWAMPGQCHWNLTNVRRLREPVECRGALGLWRPAPAIVEKVAAQLRVVTA